MEFKILHPKFIFEMKINRNKIKSNIKNHNDIETLEKILSI